MAHDLVSPKDDPTEKVEEIPRSDLNDNKPVAILTVHGGGTTLDVKSDEYNDNEMLRIFISHIRACLEPAHHTWLRNKGWTDADIVALDDMCLRPDTVKIVKEYQKAAEK